MGERKTPPLAASAALPDNEPVEKGSLLAQIAWPPQGWPMFSCITRDSGYATKPSTRAGDDDCLSYAVGCTPDGIYSIEILAGTLGRAGTSLSPLMGIRFTARDDQFDDHTANGAVELHVKGQRLIPEPGAVLRLILAMTFMVSRIDRGIAPNVRRVLKMYRLG